MTFTQETFLNSSIRNFSATVGWGDQVSTLEVGLVDDPDHGDSFDPPVVGSAVYFDYMGWRFGGLLQSSKTNYGEGGNPVYTVQVQDPRELLAGVQLILQDYTGSTYNISNLYNIYGYLENAYGFGGAQANDTGVPWKLVRDAFYNLQLTQPIYFQEQSYLFAPFYGMDVLPDYYRVGGGSISAMEFVENICAAISCDYFISLWGNVILLNLVNRSYPLRTGAIDEFVTNVEGAVSKDQGYELANNTTSKFVVGGKVANLYFQEKTYTSNNKPSKPETYYDDTILPYWGYDAWNNLIIGNGDFVSPSGTGAEYQFRIDGRPIYIQTGIPSTIFYYTDLAEMRHARDSKDSWEAFLWWKNDDPKSIHKDKAKILGIIDGVNRGLKDALTVLKEGGAIPLARAASFAGAEREKIFENEAAAIRTTRIYEYIRKYATEYYGKKFMVRIPFALVKREPESNNIVFSVKPTQAGYTDESTWGAAAGMGYMPYNVEKFTTPDNQIECYVKFSNMQNFVVNSGTMLKCRYGLDNLTPDDYILDQYPDMELGKMRENLFVRATIEDKNSVVFLDKSTLYSPRVVITLVAPVADNDDNFLTVGDGLRRELEIFLLDEDVKPAGRAVIAAAGGVEKVVKKVLYEQFGSEVGWFGKESMFHIPDLAVVPLESNILRYGPWYVHGHPGKVEYEVDDSLVPWEYGGYTLMNLAGLAKVEDALTGQQITETGTIQFPGIPNVQIGGALLEGGPIVTDISVNVGAEGVTTTYRMNTWSYQFGRIGKYNIERIHRASKVAQEQRKAFRKLFGYRDPIRISGSQMLAIKSRIRDNRSSATMLGGDVLAGGSGDSLMVKTNVAALAGYRMLSQITEDSYVNKAGMSLDGMFVPYTTRPQITISGVLFVASDGGTMVSGVDVYSSYLPHFEQAELGATEPTVENLNPFGEAGIALAFPETEGIPANLCTEYNGYDGYVKAVGLKAPIIVGGWGYDTDGNPVPAGSGGAFLDNYKNRADQWKVGPLDIRWDDSRKVWVGGTITGGSVNVKPFKLLSGLVPGGCASAREYVINQGWASGINPFVENLGADPETLYDFLLVLGRQQYANDKVLAAQLTIAHSGDPSQTSTLWVVVNGQCNC